MRGRLIALSFVLGTGLVHTQKQIIPLPYLAGVVLLLAGLLWCLKGIKSYWSLWLWMLFAGVVAVFNASSQAYFLLQEQLPVAEQNKPFRLKVQVQSLVRLAEDSRSFKALVLTSHPQGVPQEISLRWASNNWSGPYAAPNVQEFEPIMPGQVWELTAFLKTPHGARNPHAFDYESYVFAQGIRATGSIRGEPVLLSQEPEQWSIGLAAEMWRHRLREAMLPYVKDLRWGGVLLALSIGDQASGDGH